MSVILTYDLKVGYSCNNRCKHCVIVDSKDKLVNNHIAMDLTTEECLQQIDDELKKGITSIVLTGGEVTIRKDLDVILNKCIQSNLKITMQTNGRQLSLEYVKKLVKDVKEMKFVIALHGAKAKTHDSITQVKGSFQQTCVGIKEMTDLNKMVIIKVVISKINQHELADIVELVSSLGVKYICFAFPHGQGDARKNFDIVIPTYTSLKDELENTIKLAKKNNIFIEFEAIPFCIIPKHLKLVGELQYLQSNTICTQVKEDTFVWNDVRKSIKRKGKNCGQCFFDSICEGPWQEYVEAFGDNELQPILVDEKYREVLTESLKNFKSYFG
ncbi:radical SAM protein [Pelosinus sp. sgz500959]|uniref:radical SAM protein n=1 Tax=Pelosinus sp. sgz500959 TaxID=3242472 RepID=UPI00366E64D2